MKIAKLEFIPVSIPYTHREVSSQVNRDGVSDIVVKATTDDGLVGWGESCSGANIESVEQTLKATQPFVLGRSPWSSELIREELWHKGIWMFRKPTASFAYAGIDMALWDICGKACNQPLYNLFGGRVRESANYFYYLARGSAESLQAQCRDGLARGYHVFYLKVGVDIQAECEMVRVVRETIGPSARLRLDANAAWRVNEAVRNLALLDRYTIDFIEQPVSPDPVANMQEVRRRTPVAVCANEGLWSAEDAYKQITGRTADVYCFSSYWVGSLTLFQSLCRVAALESLQICKHTHGEFGIAAAAAHHLMLTLPNLVEGNQQTAQMMQDDVLKHPLPIASGPDWGVPHGPGLGIEVDCEKVGLYHERYRQHGQFQPYDLDSI
ncbi:MAG TPA: mandelate racemase/muconate lactonizing enzyme family protein [Bryobacteraceae bacterium]|nr:mandelate racemase/muconate lactonizing enzyme family protein [Bryobacteraceae bacterium]